MLWAKCEINDWIGLYIAREETVGCTAFKPSKHCSLSKQTSNRLLEDKNRTQSCLWGCRIAITQD